MSITALTGVPQVDPNAGKYVNKADTADSLQTSFMKMLTAQLQYQDPLKPMENSDFTAQVAQLNSLSQQEKSNNLLQQLVSSKQIDGVNQAVPFLGRNVLVDGDKTVIKNGQGTVNFSLNQDAPASVTIYDQTGNLVQTIDPQKYTSGDNAVDLAKFKLKDGTYSFAVAVSDPKLRDSTTVTTLESGMVSRVVNDPTAGVLLMVNGHTVGMDKIQSVI